MQASVNDPRRITRDWADIRMILEAAGEQGTMIDWPLLSDYLEIFHLEARLSELKGYYGKTG